MAAAAGLFGDSPSPVLSIAAGLELFTDPFSTSSPIPGLACWGLLLGPGIEPDPVKVEAGVTTGIGIAAGDACPISKYDPFSAEDSVAAAIPGDGTSATGI